MNIMDTIIVTELMKLSPTSEIKMTVNGDTYAYRFSQNPKEDGFELHAIDTKENIVYGLSCSSITEVIGVLTQDYASGIITDIAYVKDLSKEKKIVEIQTNSNLSYLKKLIDMRDYDGLAQFLSDFAYDSEPTKEEVKTWLFDDLPDYIKNTENEEETNYER